MEHLIQIGSSAICLIIGALFSISACAKLGRRPVIALQESLRTLFPAFITPHSTGSAQTIVVLELLLGVTLLAVATGLAPLNGRSLAMPHLVASVSLLVLAMVNRSLHRRGAACACFGTRSGPVSKGRVLALAALSSLSALAALAIALEPPAQLSLNVSSVGTAMVLMIVLRHAAAYKPTQYNRVTRSRRRGTLTTASNGLAGGPFRAQAHIDANTAQPDPSVSGIMHRRAFMRLAVLASSTAWVGLSRVSQAMATCWSDGHCHCCSTYKVFRRMRCVNDVWVKDYSVRCSVCAHECSTYSEVTFQPCGDGGSSGV